MTPKEAAKIINIFASWVKVKLLQRKDDYYVEHLSSHFLY